MGAGGYCVAYEPGSRTCKAYEGRPVFCRVGSGKPDEMTWEAWYVRNAEQCNAWMEVDGMSSEWRVDLWRAGIAGREVDDGRV